MRIRWEGRKVTKRVQQAAFEGLQDGAEHILDEANTIVPYREGTLMQSGAVTPDPVSKTVFVSYDTPYAVYLHEHPEFNFRNGREGKWLEKTMNNEARAVLNYVARRVRQEIGG